MGRADSVYFWMSVIIMVDSVDMVPYLLQCYSYSLLSRMPTQICTQTCTLQVICSWNWTAQGRTLLDPNACTTDIDCKYTDVPAVGVLLRAATAAACMKAPSMPSG